MEQELLLAKSLQGPEAPPGNYLMLLPTLLLTEYLPLATGPVWSSPRRDLHRTGGAGGSVKHHELSWRELMDSKDHGDVQRNFGQI